MIKAFVTVVGTFLILSGFGLAAFFDVLLFRPVTVAAFTDQPTSKPINQYRIVPVKAITVPIYAQSFLLFDESTGTMLSQQSAESVRPIASLTKMMTALVARSTYSPETILTTPREATLQIGSTIGLLPNEQMTVQNLLHGLLIQSGNDAAYTLALNHPEGLAGFVKAMNDQARSWGLHDAYFADPSGLDDRGYASALDLLQLARHLLRDPLLARIVATPAVTVYNARGTYSHAIRNSNRLVTEFQYAGAEGIKTGFTPEAGHVLVASANRGNRRLIAVVLHTLEDSKPASAREAQKLLDWGFQAISSKGSAPIGFSNRGANLDSGRIGC